MAGLTLAGRLGQQEQPLVIFDAPMSMGPLLSHRTLAGPPGRCRRGAKAVATALMLIVLSNLPSTDRHLLPQ
jgi:hypothetical protein